MCDICRQSPCDSRCPNYIPPNARYYCSACKDGIYEGEEYIENDKGDYRHIDCFSGMNELSEWLGYSVETMGVCD